MNCQNNRKKIGIMGGTFDPIHMGHLILGEQSYEQFQLDKVLFMPSGNPPHKRDRAGRASDNQRVDMVRLAIEDNPHFELSLAEMHETGYTYTYRTLEELKEYNPDTDYYFIIGADSHTCTYGAVNGFATGVGSTDLGAAMATGEAWFKVPEVIKVNLTGEKPAGTNGKDVILTLIGMIGVDGALYKSLEFAGPGVMALTMTDRLTISNMAIEAGGKAGIFPFDEVTKAYVDQHVTKAYEPVAADADALYCRVIDINLSELKPVVAFPHLPGNTKRVEDITEPIRIDQVIIGSCTNGRLEDMEIAATVFKDHKVADHVRCIVIPGSQAIYKEAMHRGYIDTFIDAGCAVSTPTCGPCLGGYMGIMAAGEKCVSTTNRNFRGRMGHVDSEVYLAGPHVAAASAILGRIATAEEVK